MTRDDSDPYLTSMSLLDRAAANDQEAWREMTEAYGPLVYHWCRKSGLDSDDASDIFQEVFRSLVKHLPSFRKEREGDRFRAWLYTITRNKLRDFARVADGKAKAAGGSSSYKRLMQLPEEESIEMSRSAMSTVNSIVKRKLETIRGEFRPKTFEAFYRVTIDGVAADSVAEQLGVSIDSVYQAKSRVLRRLRNELGDLI